jgi:hypothetical protein
MLIISISPKDSSFGLIFFVKHKKVVSLLRKFNFIKKIVFKNI